MVVVVIVRGRGCGSDVDTRHVIAWNVNISATQVRCGAGWVHFTGLKPSLLVTVTATTMANMCVCAVNMCMHARTCPATCHAGQVGTKSAHAPKVGAPAAHDLIAKQKAQPS